MFLPLLPKWCTTDTFIIFQGTQTQRTGRSRSNRHSSNTQLRSSAVTMATSQAGSSRASHGDLNNPTVGPYSEQSLSAIK